MLCYAVSLCRAMSCVSMSRVPCSGVIVHVWVLCHPGSQCTPCITYTYVLSCAQSPMRTTAVMLNMVGCHVEYMY